LYSRLAYFNRQFAEKHQINFESISKINIKENFILKMKSGITIHIPLEEIEMIARPACLACKSFANDFADISVGGLSSVEGYTTVVVRSIMGKRMIADALHKGVVEHKATESKQEYDVDKRRMISLIAAFTDKKKKRGERTLERLQV